MQLKRVIVTGATGFVGSNLVRRLVEEGIPARCLVRERSDRSGIAGLPVEIVLGELLEPGVVRAAMADCDACVHLAAAYEASSFDDLRRINVEGTRTVLSAAQERGLSVVVHASTMGTLGRRGGRGLLREGDSYLAQDASDYARSKYEAEAVVREFVARGLRAITALLAAPVGAWDRVPTVTGRRILSILRGELPPYLSGAINHVPVRDVAVGLLRAAREGRAGERFLLAHPEGNLTRRQLTRRVCAAAGIRPLPTRPLRSLVRRLRRRLRGERRRGPGSLACDPRWTIERLGLSPSSLDDAFAEAVAWFREP